MAITTGTKCRYKPFDKWVDGRVAAVLDDGKFLVSDGAIQVAQYDDSLREYTMDDIGTLVLIEP